MHTPDLSTVLRAVNLRGLRGAAAHLSLSLADTARLYGRALVSPDVADAAKDVAFMRLATQAKRLGVLEDVIGSMEQK